MYGALKRSAKKAKGGAKLGTIEAAMLGSGASLAAQAVTTPLDVVRTRVMTASPDDEGYEGGRNVRVVYIVYSAFLGGILRVRYPSCGCSRRSRIARWSESALKRMSEVATVPPNTHAE